MRIPPCYELYARTKGQGKGQGGDSAAVIGWVGRLPGLETGA